MSQCNAAYAPRSVALLTQPIEVRAKGDVKEGVGVDVLQHVYQIDTGIDALEPTGRQEALHDAYVPRPDFRRAKQPWPSRTS